MKSGLFVILMTVFCILSHIESRVVFTNVVCTSHDRTFSEFAYCFIKSVNRTHKYLSLRVNIYQLPVTNLITQFAFLKRMNGYKPFLYNVSFDGCAFIKNRKKFPVADYFFSFFANFSNFNHSCPYNHDIIVEGVTVQHLENNFKTGLPMPLGEYCLQTLWIIDGLLRASVRIFFKFE